MLDISGSAGAGTDGDRHGVKKRRQEMSEPLGMTRCSLNEREARMIMPMNVGKVASVMIADSRNRLQHSQIMMAAANAAFGRSWLD